MFLTQTNRLKPSKQETAALQTLCHSSKNLFNVGLYHVRQHFFQERKFLRYESNYHLSKENENYKLLATDIAQQTLKMVDRSFKSFFGLLEARKNGRYEAQANISRYLPKDGYFALIIPIRPRDWERISRKWVFQIPMAKAFRQQYGTVTLHIPERLRDKRVKEIRILPKMGARVFDVSFVYEAPLEPQVEQTGNAVGIDLGLNNLATCVSTTLKSFIVDGRKLKSINQGYNKRNAFLQSIKDLQKGGKKLSERQSRILDKRNRQVRDYLNKAARYVVDWCRSNGISQVVVGYNPTLKQGVNLGTRNNQNFTQIPMFAFKEKLQGLCERYGIHFTEQEESYTSKASAVDGDPIPTYEANNRQQYKFSGKRTRRGLYQTGQGWRINADCNGAANMLRKHQSNLNDVFGQARGCLAQPLRVQIS